MKKIFNHFRDDWYKYVLELIVITAGILGAFALNSWNESVGNRERSLKLLKSLKTEFLTNQKQLSIVMGNHLDVERSSAALLRSINKNEPMSEDSLKYHFVQISDTWTFDPQNSVLRSSISSGDIHLIENDSLLMHLFSWTDLAMDGREDEIQAKELFFDKILPLSYEYIMETDLIAEFYAEAGVYTSAHTSNYRGLVYSRTFENLIALRLENTLEILREMKPIQLKNKAILSEIDKSLSKADL